MDLSLARHVHAQALATTDPDQINGLGRTYQRIARSLRQTLALKAKLARVEPDACERTPRRHSGPRETPAPDQAYEVADAVTKVIWTEHEHEPLERETVLEDLTDRLIDMVRAKAFDGQDDTDVLVIRLCERLSLSPEAAARWKKLPEPPEAHQVWWDLTRRWPS